MAGTGPHDSQYVTRAARRARKRAPKFKQPHTWIKNRRGWGYATKRNRVT